MLNEARDNLRTVHTVIVDEIHAIAGTKRGAHLALTLERVEGMEESRYVEVRALGPHAAATLQRWRAALDGDAPVELE